MIQFYQRVLGKSNNDANQVSVSSLNNDGDTHNRSAQSTEERQSRPVAESFWDVAVVLVGCTGKVGCTDEACCAGEGNVGSRKSR
ncbi:hypothetical protein L6452_19971 [Arctium lappa]|uniref:Uncharacterized protein n=1 Tax=Arctium lappa TaxID=4217 RepID=A0ACB9BBD8_ARCLA|nr:hypothetical protein L6452_19971 [Arctium lappa]